jgi:hypothetical protein
VHGVILGDIPIGGVLAAATRFAQQWCHWFVIGQPAPLAERLIAADINAWYDLNPTLMGKENYADVARGGRPGGAAREVRGLPGRPWRRPSRRRRR